MDRAHSAILGRLLTVLGERSDYDAVSQCSRCGYCSQVCPTYKATSREALSARGRNQLARLILEGRVQEPKSAKEAFSTCLLCGACTETCPAHVPTADIVLEARRALADAKNAPAWRREASTRLWGLLVRLFLDYPRRLEMGVRFIYRLKRLGLSRLAASIGLLRLLGLRALEEADSHVSEVPDRLLAQVLREDASLAPKQQTAWRYFASCGPNFLFPRVGLATVRVLKASLGPGAFLDNPCCGLLAYNYGDLEAARSLARANIERAERAGQGGVVFADCSSCAAFLKSYPQLFIDEPNWRARAEAFAGRVKDIIELSPKVRPLSLPGVLSFHDSCRAGHGQGLRQEPRKALLSAAEEPREMTDSEDCCGGAGLFAFKHPRLSEALLKKKVEAAAAAQASRVSVSASSCMLQLARGLKKYYPECRVVHWSELVCEVLEKG
ncbi:MAG: (Fe-S)-binding protein [Elusimicrobiota bacterium]|jgi:glycolate oxidase iron-sulfur subunit